MKPTVRVAFESIRASSKILLSEQRRVASINVDSKDKLKLSKRIEGISEENLITSLQQKYPDHQFISEESLSHVDLTDEPTWVIDPLDGTHNYMSQLPFFTIAVAYYEKKRLCHGLIYAPMFDQLFYASKGEGAYLNQSRIRSIQKPSHLNVVMTNHISTDTYDFLNNSDGKFKIRQLGCASLSYCFLAQGSAHLYVSNTPTIWDRSAGELIATEAGAIVYEKNNFYAVGSSKSLSLLKHCSV